MQFLRIVYTYTQAALFMNQLEGLQKGYDNSGEEALHLDNALLWG